MNPEAQAILAADRQLRLIAEAHAFETAQCLTALCSAHESTHPHQRLTFQIQARIHARRAARASAKVQKAKLALVTAICAEARKQQAQLV